MFAQKKKSFISGKTFAVIVIILFAAGYFINTYNFFGGDDDNLSAQEMSEEKESGAISASADGGGSVSSETKLLMRIYDNVTNTTKTQELLMPAEVRGKSLEDAKTYLLSRYEDSSVREINEDYILLYRVIDKSAQDTLASDGTTDETDGAQDETVMHEQPEEYYLIKEEGGQVNIYKGDAHGNLELVLSTMIQFSLLSNTDQELFKYGVVKHTMDEVNEVLQDFEG